MLTGHRFDVEPQKIFNLEDYPELIKENFNLKYIFILNLLLNFIKDLKKEIISINSLDFNYFSQSNVLQLLNDICRDEEIINLNKYSNEMKNTRSFSFKKQEYRKRYYSYITELCLKYYEELKQEFKNGKFLGVDIRYV